ncbi:phosphatidate cytidylyltransferase [Clostridium folliculivorans]|uniref:Phosphatidate cytidylyltransferase n=1 Tax=Clostridium folliculivorans TaxID=2886038 RepID=A0A9W5Y217_9CLOT|nr:phosphatidate cytidylyltransferase [Clostridium folliculivorans]GKU25047.1 phosphatidate cytidylyltransferase [Clostridium folliculivorans]GKU31145.1 phosphatidate cytidylyltransferase [Clostridium folliculivorans]
MKQRIISSVIGLPILIGILLSKNLILLNVTLLLIITIGLNEFYKSFKDFNSNYTMIGIGFSALYYIFVLPNFSSNIGLFINLFSIFLVFYSVLFYSKQNAKNIAITFIGFFYVTYMFSFIRQIISMNGYGNIFVWFVFIIAWSADTFAYVVGKTFGKKKLTPELSPNKSIEGFMGGVIGATLMSCLYGIIIFKFTGFHTNKFLYFCLVMGVIGSVISQCGDLIASLIKRFNGIKDFGNIIPGHGGILDRFDSIILTAPFVYYFIKIMLKI